MSAACVQQLDDLRHVVEECATECALAAHKAIDADISGPNARDVALPVTLEEPLVAKRMPVVFVAERAG